jgi:hypothetical protein
VVLALKLAHPFLSPTLVLSQQNKSDACPVPAAGSFLVNDEDDTG